MTRGESKQLGRYDLKYDSFEIVDQPNHRIWEARLTVTDPTGSQSDLRPQRRIYTKTNQRTSEIGVRSTLRDDVFIILANLTEGGETVHLKAMVKPLLIWIWIGSTATVVGCLICLLPVRRKLPTGAPPAENDAEAEEQHDSLAPDDLEVQEVTR